MGRVYRARDRELDRLVAIKVLSLERFDGGHARDRFLEEGRICSQLDHPHIVRLYDFGVPEPPRMPYMVFEFVEGPSLLQGIAQGPLPRDTALERLVEIGEGLEYAHRAGIVHRDLKPENILLERGVRARIADFGLAKDAGSVSGVQTREGLLLGTPPYMAPEYIRRGETGPSVDAYAFGVLAFLLLTGRLPFDHPDPGKLLQQHLRSPPPDPRQFVPDLDPDLVRWLLRSLEKDPEARFRSLGSLARRLDRHRRGVPQGPPTKVHRPRPVRDAPALPLGDQLRRGVSGSRGKLILALLLLAVGALSWFSGRTPATRIADLTVQASPRALRVTWRASGPSSLLLTDSVGEEVLPRRRLPEEGENRVDLPGLRPGESYRIEVRGPQDERLRSHTVTTPEETPATPPRLVIEGGALSLQATRPYPFSLTWTARPPGDPAATRATGGDPELYREQHDQPIPALGLRNSVHLVCRVRPVGALDAEEHLLVDGISPLLSRTRVLLAENPRLEEALDQALSLYLGTRREVPPPSSRLDASEARAQAGLSPEIEEVLRESLRALRKPDLALEEKLELERLLLPLELFELLAAGHDRPSRPFLRRLRLGYLPFARDSTLEPGARPLTPVWKAAPREGTPVMTLVTRAFLETYTRQSEVSPTTADLIAPSTVERFLADDQSTLLELEVEDLPRAGEATELVLGVLQYPRFLFLTLELGERPALVLWPRPTGSQLRLIGDDFDRLAYRLPPGWVQSGTQRLRFRVQTLPGDHARLRPVHIVEVSLRAGAPLPPGSP